MNEALPDRFWQKVYPEPNTGCWLWGGCVTSTGYGRSWNGSKADWAHRVVYEALVRGLALGEHIDHLCRVKSCVNPDHLEPVSHRENVRRGLGGVLRTHCKRGHLVSEANKYYYKDGRGRCLSCRKIANDEWAKEKRRRKGSNEG